MKQQIRSWSLYSLQAALYLAAYAEQFHCDGSKTQNHGVQP